MWETENTMSQEQLNSYRLVKLKQQLGSSSFPLSYETLIRILPEKPKRISVQKRNSACGDNLDLQITILSGVIISIEFTGHACVLCKEQAKLLSIILAGRETSDLVKVRFEPDFDIKPNRVNCYELPYKCLEAAFERARENNPVSD